MAATTSIKKRVHFDSGIDWDVEDAKAKRRQEKIEKRWKMLASQYPPEWNTRIPEKLKDSLHGHIGWAAFEDLRTPKLRTQILERLTNPKGPSKLVRKVLIDLGAPKALKSIEEKLRWMSGEKVDFVELRSAVQRRFISIGLNTVFRQERQWVTVSEPMMSSDSEWSFDDDDEVYANGIQIYEDETVPFVVPVNKKKPANDSEGAKATVVAQKRRNNHGEAFKASLKGEDDGFDGDDERDDVVFACDKPQKKRRRTGESEFRTLVVSCSR